MAATMPVGSADAGAGGDLPPARKSRLWLSLLGGLATVGLCAGAVLLVSTGAPAAAASVRPPAAVAARAASNGSGPVAPPESVYRNGRYTATGHYLTPGGNESIAVGLDVDGDVITAATVQVEAKSPTARQFQEQFLTTIAGQITARPLSTLSVSRVSGASLTSLGFDDALSTIREEAKK